MFTFPQWSDRDEDFLNQTMAHDEPIVVDDSDSSDDQERTSLKSPTYTPSSYSDEDLERSKIYPKREQHACLPKFIGVILM